MADQIKTVVGVTGILKFCALAAPESHPDYPNDPPKYRAEFNTVKLGPDGEKTSEVRRLLNVISHVGKRTWVGAEAKKRMRAVVRTIEEGDATNSGQIGMFDGDEYKPEYNEGQYVLRASAKSNAKPVFRKWSDEEEKYVITDEAPEPGDLVKVSIEVWAMKQHSRVNFTIKAIQVVKDGKGFAPVTGGQPVTESMLDDTLDDEPEVLELFAGLGGGAKQIGAGGDHGYDDEGETTDEDADELDLLEDDEEEDEESDLLDDEEEEEEPPPPPKRTKRKKAPKKKAAAKKKAAKKKTAKKSKAIEPDDVLPPEDDDEDDDGDLFAGL